MSTIINATTTNGVVIQPDNSGSLVLQSNGTTIATVASTGITANGGGAISSNTAFGASALAANSTGIRVTAIGNQALQNNTASENTAIGARAMITNTSGTNNTAVGRDSMYFNTTGGENSALGLNSLIANTTGSNNTAIGRDALQANTTASSNTAVGYQAGYTATTAGFSCYIGGLAGTLSTGASNNYIGYAAGASMTSGAKNTILGSYNGNQGGLDIRTASNNIVLSDGDGTWGFRVAFATNKSYFNAISSGAGTNALRVSTSTGEITYDTSSARYKDNIRDSVYGLDDVMQLRSAQFEYKDGGRSDVGLIAEEVQLIIPELVGVNKDGLADSVSYDRLVSVCIKAIQELNAKVTALEAQLEAK